MITTIISWLLIFYTLFSLGDFFISFYNKVCKNKENYNLTDIFILGICAACILLSLSSLWLPSNHYILFTFIAIGSIHWIFNFKRLKGYLSEIKDIITSTTILQKILIITPFLAVLIYTYIFDHHYDAEYYHYQQIRWNEEYAVVPGLGNLEDRFGFNSNYLLLSAIFTFRFLFGDSEAIYSLSSLLYVCILVWIMISFIKSGYNMQYIILLALAFFILLFQGYMLGSSSTDIIPILCIFYFLAKGIINPHTLKEQVLFTCLVPVTIITFKLSTIILCLIPLFILIYLIKEKKYRELTFIICSCVLVVSLWCTRNVIISGYLVYPLYTLDLFNFDWKVPKGTAMIQYIYIRDFAQAIFSQEIFKASEFLKGQNFNLAYIGSFINILFAIITLLSPFYIIYKYIKKKLDAKRLFLYIIIFISIIFNYYSAPDFRFTYGYIFGLVFLLYYIIHKPEKQLSDKAKTISLTLSIIILSGFCFTAAYKFIDAGKRIGIGFHSFMDFAALYHHRNAKNLNSFEEYKMGDFIVYTTKERYDNRTFDILPATDPNGIPFEPFNALKIQDIRTIEPRGKTLQDGFRTKKEYIDIINKGVENSWKDYYKYK